MPDLEKAHLVKLEFDWNRNLDTGPFVGSIRIPFRRIDMRSNASLEPKTGATQTKTLSRSLEPVSKRITPSWLRRLAAVFLESTAARRRYLPA